MLSAAVFIGTLWVKALFRLIWTVDVHKSIISLLS